MEPIAQILALADAYAEAEGVETSTVSWRAFGDTKKLDALRNGADIQTRRCARAIEWFSANWPAGATWPAGVVRPQVDRAA